MNIGITISRLTRLTNTTSHKLLLTLKPEVGICIYSVCKKITYHVDHCTYIFLHTALDWNFEIEFFGDSNMSVSFSIDNYVNGNQCITGGRQLFYDGLPSKFNPFKPYGPAKYLIRYAITCQLGVAYQ